MRIAALLMVILGLTGAVAGEEPASIKIVHMFGLGGPVRGNANYRPGEMVFARAITSGLTTNGEGDVFIAYKLELLDKDDQWVGTLLSGEQKHRPYAAGTFPVTGILAIPADAGGKEYRLLVTIFDKFADKKIETKSAVFVSEETTPAPLSVRFASDRAGRETGSGRFVEGDNGYLHFAILTSALDDDDELTCSLTFAEKGSSWVSRPTEFVISSEARKAQASELINAHFRLSLDRKFKGVARLGVRLNNEDYKVVEIPIEVLPPLGE